jgi:hypothetical protein
MCTLTRKFLYGTGLSRLYFAEELVMKLSGIYIDNQERIFTRINLAEKQCMLLTKDSLPVFPPSCKILPVRREEKRLLRK